MAKAKAVAMPDFIPDEEISQYESAPDFISDEEMAGTAAPVNAAEELRAKRVRTASPQELRKIHFGENVPAGARAEQVSPISEFATGFGIRGPAKAIGGIGSAAQEIYRTAGKPIEQAKMLGGALRGIATQPFKDVGQLATGTPTEAGESAFNLGALTAPAAPALKAGGAQAVSRLQTKAGQIASRPKSLAYGALSERIGPGTAKAQRLEKEINTGLEPVFDFAANAKRKINNVEDLGSAAKDMAKVTDFEFNQAVDRVGDRLVSGRPVAQEIRDEITDLVRTTNPAQAENLERIAASFDRDMPISEVNQSRREITSKLDKFYSKSPLEREHSPLGIEAEASMAEGLRKVLYDNLDEIYADSPSIRQMMRERGAAEGISKYASESSGAARRQGMAETNVRGPVTTPMTLGAKAVKTVFSPTQTAKKVEKFAQRPDRKISEAYKLYIPRKARAPIGQPGPHGLPSQGPTPEELLQNAGGQIRYGPTIGEAASTGADVPLSQTLRYQGYPEAATIDENFVRTTSRPVEAYHGTGNVFEKFGSGEGIGPHFGTKEQANAFATEAAESGLPGHVRKVQLDFKNPLKVDFDSGWENPALLAINLQKKGILKPGEGDRIGAAIFDKQITEQQAFEQIRQNLAAQGYDSIAYPNRFEGEGLSYISLKPSEQIR